MRFGTVTKAKSITRPPQFGQERTSKSKVLFKSSPHRRYALQQRGAEVKQDCQP